MNSTDPKNPGIVGQLSTTTPIYDASAFKDVALTSDGTIAVVASGLQGIRVIDVSVPSAPTQIGSYNTPGTAYGVTLNSAGTIAYVADGSSGLQILSLSNPRSPALLGSKTVSGTTMKDVALAETSRMAYLSDQNGRLITIDVSTASSPILKNSTYLSGGSGQQIAVDELQGTLAVIELYSGTASLEIFNIADNPAAPAKDGYVAVGPDDTGGVALIGGYAYVAAASEGLKKYNSTGAPVWRSTVQVPGEVCDVAVNSSYAYATGFPAAVSVIKFP
jgi:hypothetical protein